MRGLRGWDAEGWSRWAEEERRLLSGIDGHGASAREEREEGGGGRREG